VLLSRNAGRVLTHDYMIRQLWGPFSSDSQILRVNVANIRRKIESNPADPRYILTEIGVGYRMSEPGIP
jgi:two-component system KDP operon response regulator KdpE